MEASRPGRREANAKSAGEFRIAACHEGGRFFVANLNKPNLFLPFSQRLHDPVDAVTRQTEDDLDAPVVKSIDENICRRIRHETLPWNRPLRPSLLKTIGRRCRAHLPVGNQLRVPLGANLPPPCRARLLSPRRSRGHDAQFCSSWIP